MSIETKRGYRITQLGKEITITCPTEEDASIVFESLKVNVLIGQLQQKMGKVKRFEPYTA